MHAFYNNKRPFWTQNPSVAALLLCYAEAHIDETNYVWVYSIYDVHMNVVVVVVVVVVVNYSSVST